MSAPSSFHARFSAALTDRSVDARPAGFDAQQSRRFAVYRNNVHLGLREALGAAYPVVLRLVGVRFFSAMARDFCSQERRRSGSMALYGEGLADFIDAFAPAESVPYLGDVARLERAWLECHHGADAATLNAASLAGHGEKVATLQFSAHPAARLVKSRFPVADIWAANTQQQAPSQEIASQEIVMRPQCVLLTRPAMEVVLSRVEPAAFSFAAAMLAGASAVAALSSSKDAAFDAAATFRTLVSAGALAGIVAPGRAT